MTWKSRFPDCQLRWRGDLSQPTTDLAEVLLHVAPILTVVGGIEHDVRLHYRNHVSKNGLEYLVVHVVLVREGIHVELNSVAYGHAGITGGCGCGAPGTNAILSSLEPPGDRRNRSIA